MSQPYQVITTFSSAELHDQLAAGGITFEDWRNMDPEYLAKTLFPNGGGIPREVQLAESTAQISITTDSLDSDDMFVPAQDIHSGLPHGESDDDEETQAEPAASAEPEYPPVEFKKRGRPRVMLTQKHRKKNEKQLKKAEEEEKKNIALCARYQVVLENNPWQFKRNTTAYNTRWALIVKVLKGLNLLDNAPSSGRSFQTYVSKTLAEYEKVFIKRPSGEEPPEKTERDNLVGDMYDLKKSGEGPNPKAEDRNIGLAKRKKATLRLGMSTGNKSANLREIADDDDHEIPTSEEEATNGHDEGYTGRLNRRETYELDFAGPEFRQQRTDDTGESSQIVAKKKTTSSGRVENVETDSDKEGDNAPDVDSPQSSGSKSGDRKRKGEFPEAAHRGKKKDIVDAVTCFTDGAKDQGQIQWKIWTAEQREMEAERKFQHQLEQQKLAHEREKMNRKEESQKKDRELDLQKYMLLVNAMKEIACDVFKENVADK